jgi:HEAT repeat protein
VEAQLAATDDLACEAAEALGLRGDALSLPALAEAATRSGGTRAAALTAIERITGKAAAHGLASLLRHAEASTRASSVAALARCPGALEAIVPYLSDERPDVRGAAAEALGRTGDPRAVQPLLAVHDGGDADVRRAAAASLVRLGFDA